MCFWSGPFCAGSKMTGSARLALLSCTTAWPSREASLFSLRRPFPPRARLLSCRAGRASLAPAHGPVARHARGLGPRAAVAPWQQHPCTVHTSPVFVSRYAEEHGGCAAPGPGPGLTVGAPPDRCCVPSRGLEIGGVTRAGPEWPPAQARALGHFTSSETLLRAACPLVYA